jgi:hypothetical protein
LSLHTLLYFDVPEEFVEVGASQLEREPRNLHHFPVVNLLADFELLSWHDLTILVDRDDLVLQHVYEVLLTEKWCSAAVTDNNVKYVVVDLFESSVELPIINKRVSPL